MDSVKNTDLITVRITVGEWKLLQRMRKRK